LTLSRGNAAANSDVGVALPRPLAGNRTSLQPVSAISRASRARRC